MGSRKYRDHGPFLRVRYPGDLVGWVGQDLDGPRGLLMQGDKGPRGEIPAKDPTEGPDVRGSNE